MFKLRKSQENVAKAQAIDLVVSSIEEKILWYERDLQADLDNIDELRQQEIAEYPDLVFDEEAFQKKYDWRFKSVETTRVIIATFRKIINDLCK